MKLDGEKIYLYVKIHNITGLKYFGKTINPNPFLYKGSGTYWRRHIKKYGYDVTTNIIGVYTDKQKCLKDALKFSNDNNIVESAEWANLKLETLDGGDTSYTQNYKNSLSKIKESHKDSKWWNNDIIQVFSKFPPDESYKRGRLNFNNRGAKIGANKQKGKIWINNGKTEMMVISSHIPEGFIRGRIKEKCFSNGTKRANSKGTSWWNNGQIEKMCINPPDETFIKGRLKNIS